MTYLDPLEFNLIFERFLNPERESSPDIDLDIEDARRQEVYDYAVAKYGVDNVAQIITFGTMAARGAVRDVGRVLEYPIGEVDEIAKMIAEGDSISEALENVPELKTRYDAEPRLQRLLDAAMSIEGLARHSSVHACGVVISKNPLIEHIPLQRAGQDGGAITQLEGPDVEACGLVKMDFLGLKTLGIIDGALRRIRETGKDLDLDSIPVDDPEVFALFSRAETVGIFQFESGGMRDNLKKLKPSSLEDLIAMNALYRPGPMRNIDTFVARKHGREEIVYLHPLLEPILKPTYGVIVYQEQVMKVVAEIGGFSLGKADILRRAMGKKKIAEMERMKPEFLAGAAERGIAKHVANQIWDLIEKFASYGFNKSHAAAYTWLAYQTAYLKVHYPAEFMAAVMSNEHDNKKLAFFKDEAERLGVQIVYPDLNKSGNDFLVRDGKIYYGLSAIKNVGKNVISAIVEERETGGEFTDLFDFVSRVDTHRVGRRAVESMIQAGALDCLPGNRAQKFQALEDALRYAELVRQQKSRNQLSLFGEGDDALSLIPKPVLPDMEEWSSREKLALELELLGFYTSGHPLDEYRELVQIFSTTSLDQLEQLADGMTVRFAGVVSGISRRVIKRNNRPMILFNLEDLTGQAKMRMFDEAIRNYQSLLEEGALLVVKGRLQLRDDEPVVTVEELIPLREAREKLASRVTIDLEGMPPDERFLEDLAGVCAAHPGPAQLCFTIRARDGKRLRLLSGNYRLQVDNDLLRDLEEVVGTRPVVVD